MSKQLGVMEEETCKAKILRWLKVSPKEKRSPGHRKGWKAKCLQKKQQCNESARSLHSCLLCWTCSLLDMHLSAFAQDKEAPTTLPSQKEMGLPRVLQQPVLWHSLSGHSRTAAEIVPCMGTLAEVQDLRRAMVEPRVHWTQTMGHRQAKVCKVVKQK